jgi:hypothetical protein
VRALGSLTSLRDLSWSQHGAGDVSSIVPAVEQLTQLTQLRMSGSLSGQQFRPQQLPTTLVQLSLPELRRAAMPLQISHLTNLLRLTYAGDLLGTHQLPRSLTQLKVGACYSYEPLLPLQSLRALTFGWDMNAPEPCRLAEVTQLQQLELTSTFGVSIVDGEVLIGGKWDDVLSRLTVPVGLQRLRLDGCGNFGESACESLAAFTQLQKLALHSTILSVAPARLGVALCGLSHLTELQLHMSRYAASAAAELRPLCESITMMPALRRLSATDLRLCEGAVAALASATQLTALWLERCDLTPEHISALRTGLGSAELHLS